MARTRRATQLESLPMWGRGLVLGFALLSGCTGSNTDCAIRYLDADGDGFGDRSQTVACGEPGVFDGTDCDDGDASRNPEAEEICNDVDDDCNGVIDDAQETLLGEPRYLDADSDGFGTGEAWVGCGQPPPLYTATIAQDCDDASAERYPGAPERCSGADDDCNGAVDDFPIDAVAYYFDRDLDGFGADLTEQLACDPSELLLPPDVQQGLSSTYVDQLWTTVGGDCDSLDRTVYPGAPEACNGRDDDCDFAVDEDLELFLTGFVDRDGDGFGDEPIAVCNLEEIVQRNGEFVLVSALDGDCDDEDDQVHPNAVEVCNTIDDDCDGDIDDADANRSISGLTAWRLDLDDDGYGDPSSALFRCQPPVVGATVDASDCDDGDDTRRPDADEVCNGIDDDCDGHVDDLDPSLVGGPCL